MTITRSAAGLALLVLLAGHAWAEQKPPAGRAGMDPGSRSKVANVMARTYLEEPMARARVERETVTGPSGKGCTTNIGKPVTEGAQGIGNRYGAGNNNDQVIVVRGSVINVCK